MSRSKKYKAVCFDYYGTLVDTNKPFDCVRKWISDNVSHDYPVYSHMIRQYAKQSTESVYTTGEVRLSTSLQYAANRWNLPVDLHTFSHFLFDLFTSPMAYSDALNSIQELKCEYLVGIASNADNHIIKESIKRNGFEFDFIITSEDAKADKPSDRFYNHVKEILDMPAEDIIMVGDSWKEDVIGARQAGFDSLWINREFTINDNNDMLPVRVINALSEVKSSII